MFVEFFWHLGASFHYRRCQLRATIKQTQGNFQHSLGVFLPKCTHESSKQQDKITTVWSGIKASHIPKNQCKKVSFSSNWASTCYISAKPPLPPVPGTSLPMHSWTLPNGTHFHLIRTAVKDLTLPLEHSEAIPNQHLSSSLMFLKYMAMKES